VPTTEGVFTTEELGRILVVEPDSLGKGEELTETLPKTLGLSVRVAVRPGELVAPTVIDTKGDAVKILGVSLCDALCEEDDVVVGVIEIVPTTEGVLRKEVLGLILVVEPDSVAKGEGLNEYKAVTLFAETLPKTLGLSVTLALILGEVVGPTLVDTKGEGLAILGVAR